MIYNKRKKEIYKERKKSESLVFYDIKRVKERKDNFILES